MTLVLDTSILIGIERRDKPMLEKLKALVDMHPAPASIAFMAYFEFIHGIRERSPKNKEKAVSFVEIFHFLEPTKRTAGILSDLKHKYEKRGKSFSLADLLIASQVIEHNMTLVTGDRHFEEIDELKKVVI